MTNNIAGPASARISVVRQRDLVLAVSVWTESLWCSGIPGRHLRCRRRTHRESRRSAIRGNHRESRASCRVRNTAGSRRTRTSRWRSCGRRPGRPGWTYAPACIAAGARTCPLPAEQLAIHFDFRGRESLLVALEVDAQREILAAQLADLGSEALARRVVGLVDELDHVPRMKAALAAGERSAQG